MAHPHTGNFLLSGKCIRVPGLTLAIVKSRDEHIVRCCQVCGVAATFRTQVLLGIWIGFRIGIRIGFTAGEVPVAAVLIQTTPQGIIVGTRDDTSRLGKFTV